MTSELNSESERRPNESRRELRLRAEHEKVAVIAHERERERIRAKALRRAAEIRREREETVAREADQERFQQQVNDSQQVPLLGDADRESPPLSVENSQQVPLLSYAERGHKGARRRLRKEAREHSKNRARAKAAPTPMSAAAAARAHRFRNGAGRVAVVMVVSGLLAVLALPATGFNVENNGWAAETDNNDQPVRITAADSEAEQVALGVYAVTTYSDLLKLTYGASQGFSYSVTNSGPIRWPFPVVVPISSGFGGRVAPCFGCSSYHEGLDFNPVEGTPFYAIAAGKVVSVTDDAWGLGKWVLIRHVVGKQSFESLYAHMLRDSTGVKAGQDVEVGDYIGRVGNSGTSTGSHLHLEIFVDGVAVDPFGWLKKNAKGNRK